MYRNPLNAVDGNTLNCNPDHNECDEYHCLQCDGYVPEDEWNDKRGVCYSCWWKLC